MKFIPIAASWDMGDCMVKASMYSVSKVKQQAQIWPWTRRISKFKRNWITWYWCSIIWWKQYTKCKNVISFNWNLICLWGGVGGWVWCVYVCVCAHMCICMCWYTGACMGVEGNLTYCSSEVFHLIIWDQVPGWSDTWPRGEVSDQWPLGCACLCLPQWDWKCRWLWPVASSWVLGSNASPCPCNASILWTETPHVPWQFMLISAIRTNFLLNALL